MIKELVKRIVLGKRYSSETFTKYLRSRGVRIGEDVTFFVPSKITVDEIYPWMISIGNHVRITEGCKILSHDFAWSVPKTMGGAVLGASGRVEIGNNVFIGMNSIICRNVSIGENVIIGAGSVGSTIAYTLSNQNVASEIVLIDINKEKVEGEVMDIAQGTCFRDPISIIAGEYEDAKDSDIVIITSGIARKPGQTRIELTQTNVNILKSITPEIVKVAPHALYIIVSNPVDIMTYVFTKISGLPENQIIGSGTILDSARLRCGLSEHLNVAQNNIHAYVFGEHGDTSFIPWTGAYVSGVSLDEYYDIAKSMGKEVKEVDKDAMLEYVQKSGGQIIKRKGATFYAVSASVCKLCSILSASSDSITTVSSMMHGEYGIDDVCLSTLTLVGPNGIQGKVPMRMNKKEIEQLHKSADALKAVIAQIDLD